LALDAFNLLLGFLSLGNLTLRYLLLHDFLPGCFLCVLDRYWIYTTSECFFPHLLLLLLLPYRLPFLLGDTS